MFPGKPSSSSNSAAPSRASRAPHSAERDAELRERATCPITGEVTLSPMRGPDDRYVVDRAAAETWARTCETAGRPVTHPLHRGPMNNLQPDHKLQHELLEAPWVVNEHILSPAGLTVEDIEAFLPRAGGAGKQEWDRHVNAAEMMDRSDLALEILDRVLAEQGAALPRAKQGLIVRKCLLIRMNNALVDKDPDLAEAYCHSVPQSLQQDPDILCLLGNAAIQRRQWGKAIVVLERCISESPGRPNADLHEFAYNLLAFAHKSRGAPGDPERHLHFKTLENACKNVGLEGRLKSTLSIR